MLFQIPKVQTFESQSQHNKLCRNNTLVVPDTKGTNFWEPITTKFGLRRNASLLFQIPKVQTFESQSQLFNTSVCRVNGCSRYQRYKLLRANHNQLLISFFECGVVPDTKGTNFWEPITTNFYSFNCRILLFQIPKVQTFESQSQPVLTLSSYLACCSRYQRYKLLRANHNIFSLDHCTCCCSRYQRYKLLRANHNVKTSRTT